MKRKELVKKIEKEGCVLIRHGGKHDWYQNPETKISQPVPRHSEINEYLAKHIEDAENKTGLRNTIEPIITTGGLFPSREGIAFFYLSSAVLKMDSIRL